MEELKKLVKNHALGNPVRLGVMVFLIPRRKALFKDLLKVLEVTPGNLDFHLKILEKEGYVKIYKVFADRPRTIVEATDEGVAKTKEFLRTLMVLVSK
ncbi:transcriptional regulator [Thermococcus chitonophagus]|uniref:Transcriptional regulator n=1 Tax=Thermococcus chitonophagus TaxID=54262 RepID=A0A160VRR5_9EURY|nr:transcriptional regulator [Thermococcus chitonophagus]ASJ16572.1 transcriptional regulator [Thermococcus chitonophagus]CUX77512.1 hypothetical protein CHITON_0733 [Thermococcus chitonophagus]